MLYKTHKYPVQLFLFFEKVEQTVWSSKIARANCFFTLLPGKLNFSLAVLLKNELFLSPSYVVDASCVDEASGTAHNTGGVTVFYTYYFFFLKKRIVFLFPKVHQLASVDAVYPSAGWLEREFSEMFGVCFSSKVDSRNLLLDYSLNECPLLKFYPSVGLREVHYSVLTESIVYTDSSSVEL